jgi:hypothetical protein
MLVYPQLRSGALAQFPLQRRHHFRTLANTAADGTAVKLADPGAENLEWQLNYTSLSDAELALLLQFFAAAEGALNTFTFVDPTANLLAWSGDLSNAVWNLAPLLSCIGSITDPTGGANAWSVTNSGSAVQDLSQMLTAPGGYSYCFSLYARSSVPGPITLIIGGNRCTKTVASTWQRFWCAGAVDADASSVTFGIEIGPSATVDVYGLQAEPQDFPSLYKPSTTGGCYENARLRDDTLSFTTTDVNHHSATVHIFYATHL